MPFTASARTQDCVVILVVEASQTYKTLHVRSGKVVGSRLDGAIFLPV